MIFPDLYFETERLIIRPFTLNDIEPSYQMNLDSEVSRYTGDGGVVSKEEMTRRIKDNVMGDYEKYGFGRMAVDWKNDRKFIGFTGLKYLDDLDEVDIGFRFKRDFWKRGIATESALPCVQYGFEKLNLKRMIGMVLPENSASIRVLEKLGFTFEKDIEEDGRPAKQYSLAIQDWQEKVKKASNGK